MAEDKNWQLLRDELRMFRSEVKNGFDQTNERLDQANIRLDATINMVRDFRKDVSTKLDGIGNHLLSLDGNMFKH